MKSPNQGYAPAVTRRRKWDRGWWLLQQQRLHLPDPTPPPGGGPVEIGEVLPTVLRKAGLDRSLWRARVEAVWPEIVGGLLAGRSRPGAVEGTTLVVYVQHSIVLHELARDRSAGERLLENLRERLPDAPYHAVRFALDPGDRENPT
jgi:hypothetical protein